MNSITSGDYITIAIGELTIRCTVLAVGEDRYLVQGVSFPFKDWIDSKCIINATQRSISRVSSDSRLTRSTHRSMWGKLLC